MRKAAVILAGLAALAACGPRLTEAQKAEAACRASGGEMRKVGRLRTLQCVILYRDAGKPCRSGADCQGDCIVPGNLAPLEGRETPGVCQKDSDRFGCRTTVEDGKAEATICVD